MNSVNIHFKANGNVFSLRKRFHVYLKTMLCHLSLLRVNPLSCKKRNKLKIMQIKSHKIMQIESMGGGSKCYRFLTLK